MRRPFMISTGVLVLALLPAALVAQTPPAQPPPAQPPPAQPPAQQPPTEPATPEKPTEPKVGFTTPAGMLLVQIKPDQTAAFEELITKLKAALAATADPDLKAQGDTMKVFKSGEGMGDSALYVVLVDPAKAGTEYNPIDVLFKTMTDDEKRAPETTETLKRYANAFSGVNKLTLTPVGGGM